jgi:hypothetical protein
MKCQYCKKEYKFRSNKTCCNYICSAKLRLKKIKENPVLYKKFKEQDNKRKHKYRFGTNDLSEIFKRFDGKCKFCGVKAQVIHHIDGNGDPRDKSTLNNNIDNLIPLCRACHAKLHFEQGDLNLKNH